LISCENFADCCLVEASGDWFADAVIEFFPGKQQRDIGAVRMSV